MKNKIWITVGLQASGKTSWANKKVDEGQGKIVNINKDDLRLMLHNNNYSKGRESLIIKMQESMILTALNDDKDVIISDTNLNAVHIDRIKNKFSDRAEIIIEDSFLKVSLEECINRDKNRIKSVGENVIRDTYNRWIKKEEEVKTLVQDTNLPNAVIFDVDGTLAHMNNRGPFEWHRVKEDSVDEIIAQMARDCYNLGYVVIIVSGRDGVCENDTVEWLIENNIPFNKIFMRKPNDMRKDSLIKQEIFFEDIFGKWNVRYVVDDRNQVVDTWREIGLKCLQCAPGDF